MTTVISESKTKSIPHSVMNMPMNRTIGGKFMLYPEDPNAAQCILDSSRMMLPTIRQDRA